MTLAGTLRVPPLALTGTSLRICRDSLVANAIGVQSYGGVSYYTDAQNVTGLLAPGSEGINHGAYLKGCGKL